MLFNCWHYIRFIIEFLVLGVSTALTMAFLKMVYSIIMGGDDDDE